MRVVFLGNHTVGVVTLKSLMAMFDVVGVVAHPIDLEDGKVYESVYDYSINQNLPVIRGRAKDSAIFNFIKNLHPDLLWVTDYKYLLPSSIIALSVFGAINLHPSLLPKYRGRAPINWAIIEGQERLGLTAHFIDEGTDTGDIIMQKDFLLEATEDVNDALLKLYPLYESISCSVASMILSGTVPRIPQPASLQSPYPVRKPDDGLINWLSSSTSILNLVRAVAAPYPGAFTYFEDIPLHIWKASSISSDSIIAYPDLKPGFITDVYPDDSFSVTCGTGQLKIKSWSVPTDCSFSPSVGIQFRSNQ